MHNGQRGQLLVKAVGLGLGVAALLSACGESPTAAAPVAASTVTVTAPTTQTATTTMTATATQTLTTRVSVTQTLRVTQVTKVPAPTTILKTVDRPVTKTATVTAEPAAAAGSFGDGTYLVGKDIQPGTYQASSPTPSSSADLCYWEKSTRTGDLIDNGVNNGVMYVASSDFSVRVDGCGTWSLVG